MSSGKARTLLRAAGLGLAVCVVVAGGVFLLGRSAGDEAQADPGDSGVKVIRPVLVKGHYWRQTLPATVAPYYQVELRSRVAGPVLSVTKTIGADVVAGEELIHISVPDLEQEVVRKEAIVQQRKRELDVARKMERRAWQDTLAARENIDVKRNEVTRERAEAEFRLSEYKAFSGMVKDGTLTKRVRDERWKHYQAALAATYSAEAAVKKAKAEALAAEAKWEQEKADIDLKNSMVDVALKDLELAEDMLGFATLRAPFDGRVTRRHVDPGTFVQNSSSGVPGPGLLTLEYNEIVTVCAYVPDTYAKKVNNDTKVEIVLSDAHRVKIPARISRLSQTLLTQAQDRTMRVEVDLYNRGPNTFAAFENRLKARRIAGFVGAGANLGGLCGLVCVAKADRYPGLKDGNKPIFSRPVNQALKDELGLKRLLPGMYGHMTLLDGPIDVYLVQSSAVFTRRDKDAREVKYLYLVRDGVAHLREVEVKHDDGKVAQVNLLPIDGKGPGRPLTHKDVIVLSNQGELRDGQKVATKSVVWDPKAKNLP
jgi:multidrug resistance efflux pump